MSLSSPARRCAGAVLLVMTGCAQVLGLHERSEVTDAGPTTIDAQVAVETSTVTTGECGRLPHGSASCAQCMDTNCCAQARACAADPGCDEASTCLAGCTDAACEANCEAFYPDPDALIALRACRVQQCATACGSGSTCGEFASGASTCESCLQSTCCAQGAACASDTVCGALVRCTSNCFSAASCPTACQMAYPLGTADFAAWSACTDTCAMACQPGQNWACLNSPIIWPTPKGATTISFSVTFVDFSDEQPFVMATVKACDKLDFSCASPLAQSTTDATGLVSLTVPAGLSGFDGYLDVTGGQINGTGAEAGTGTSVFPAIWYPIPFVVADGWRGRTTLPSMDELSQFAQATGTTLDPARGHFAVNATDCIFGPAAGVSFAADVTDAETKGFYLLDYVPVVTQMATDASGIGGFINLPTVSPARLVVIQATAGAAGGKSMGSYTFVVRPATFTTASSFPPAP